MNKIFSFALLLMIFCLTACDQQETEPLAGPAKKLPPPAAKLEPAPSASPSLTPPTTTVITDKKETVEKIVSTEAEAETEAEEEAFIIPPLSLKPLAEDTKKLPRIDVIAPARVRLSLVVFFDNAVICNLSGKLVATTHREFENNILIAEGACVSEKILSAGHHEYQVKGIIILPNGTRQEVSFATGMQDVTDVIQPSIEISKTGEFKLKLAVG